MSNLDIKLRYLVVERKERWYPSWNSTQEDNFMIVQDKPKLQYSLDGGNIWIDVETFVRKVE